MDNAAKYEVAESYVMKMLHYSDWFGDTLPADIMQMKHIKLDQNCLRLAHALNIPNSEIEKGVEILKQVLLGE